jgi:hypothetical protein
MAATIAPADLDAAIISYLPLLSNEEKSAILNVMSAFAPVPDAGDHWDDPHFVAEMEQRYEDYKTNRHEMKTWEEVKAGIKRHLQETRQKGKE